jgi:hypothetical protein
MLADQYDTTIYFFLDLTTFNFFAFPFSVAATGDRAGQATGSMMPSSSSILLLLQMDVGINKRRYTVRQKLT